ncbi:MAG: proton-conducting transporter membrane subunit [Bradymonadaceae bacterium]
MTYLIDLLSRHWPTLPLVLPLIGGFATALVPRYRTRSRRTIAVLALAATAFASTYAVEAAAGGVITTYEVSGWAAPFGIELVVDRLAALMLATTSLLGLSALLYSLFGTDLRGDYFHALFLVQIAGINGAFLTGDLFNLFVFFEVLLISSYSLLVFGGGERRTGAATHYIVLNLVGSAIFLMGVGLLYGITGTLNSGNRERAGRNPRPGTRPGRPPRRPRRTRPVGGDAVDGGLRSEIRARPSLRLVAPRLQ